MIVQDAREAKKEIVIEAGCIVVTKEKMYYVVNSGGYSLIDIKENMVTHTFSQLSSIKSHMKVEEVIPAKQVEMVITD